MALLVATGAAYEALSRYHAVAKYPPPGKPVDIGGRKTHLDCRGNGFPTVIFEAGLDLSGSLSWTKVHDAVAGVTRACAYDRAGIMWSDPKATPQHADSVADDLNATLMAAGEKGPFVLVAHSIGGPYALSYTRKFGDQVAGLVFVDTSHPDQDARLAEEVKPKADHSAEAMKSVMNLSWTGIIRLTMPSEGPPNVPASVTQMTNAYSSTSFAGALSEMEGLDRTKAEGRISRALGDRPLIVLTAMAPLTAATLKSQNMTKQEDVLQRGVWQKLQQDEASWSTRGRQVLVPDASHYIQFDRPDIVIDAIRDVVDTVRSDAKVDDRSARLLGLPQRAAW
ncbi:alpha/beta hydrolase [Rhodopseudomonas sp. P2A-2r]|uniref:alpha/beta fold hydrolase n=1 Tax=Rhodopseudomonas sp. P2A-2r TaxID=2991972 RepID=UPI00223443ED|nr:alpha/beta hydrolase [Rhodopseudomonas sp. P2A-2r]UZE46733.1 alpha/beta hydrolase [Rhodopseudomonas sp. P2A-2r]